MALSAELEIVFTVKQRGGREGGWNRPMKSFLISVLEKQRKKKQRTKKIHKNVTRKNILAMCLNSGAKSHCMLKAWKWDYIFLLEVLSNNGSLMFYVLCFMFYVLCFMFYVLYFMFYVLCFMFYFFAKSLFKENKSFDFISCRHCPTPHISNFYIFWFSCLNHLGVDTFLILTFQILTHSLSHSLLLAHSHSLSLSLILTLSHSHSFSLTISHLNLRTIIWKF